MTHVLMVISIALLMTSLWTVIALNCSNDKNTMTPEDPFVFFGDPLRLCCKVTQAERNVTNPDDVMFYRIDSDVTGGQVSWGDEENTSVCWEHQLKEKEDEEGEESAKSILHGTFYYCRLRPAEGQNETYGQCLGYQSVQSDRSLWRVVQQVTVRCVTEDGQLQCQWPDITDRFLYPRRLALPRLLYGHTRADNDNCTVTCEGGVCRSCRLQQGRDFQLHDDFVLHVSVQWRYMPDTLYGDPLHTPRPKYHNITLSPRERVKLSAPKDVTVTSPRPRCMQLTWLPGETAGATTLIYWLTIRAEGGQLPVKDEEFAERNMSVPSASREVCGLFPFTVYVLSLQRRADYSDVWSDGIHTSAQTLMAPPDESPEIAPGYLIGPDQLLTIFWKPISENTTNGPDVQYMVNTSRPAVKEGDDHRVLSSLLTNSTHLSVAGDQWRRGDGHMVLHVQAVNQAGPAGNSSRLTLDLTSDGAKKVRGIVEKETKDQMTLNITWHPEQSRDYSYTVHWCLRTGPNSNDCHSQLQWRTLEAKRAWYIQQVPRSWLGRLLYGVSLNKRTYVSVTASGFRFHACLYDRKEDGALQMLYSSGCKETPQTYTGSGLSRSLLVTVLAVSGTVAVTLLAICLNSMRKRYLQRKNQFSPTIPEAGMENYERPLLTPADISLPLTAQNGRPCVGQEKTNPGKGGGNDRQYTPADPRHPRQHLALSKASAPYQPRPASTRRYHDYTELKLAPNTAAAVRFKTCSPADQHSQGPCTLHNPQGARSSEISPKSNSEERTQSDCKERTQSTCKERTQSGCKERTPSTSKERTQFDCKERTQSTCKERTQSDCKERTPSTSKERTQFDCKERTQSTCKERTQSDCKERTPSTSKERTQSDCKERIQSDCKERTLSTSKERTQSDTAVSAQPKMCSQTDQSLQTPYIPHTHSHGASENLMKSNPKEKNRSNTTEIGQPKTYTQADPNQHPPYIPHSPHGSKPSENSPKSNPEAPVQSSTENTTQRPLPPDQRDPSRTNKGYIRCALGDAGPSTVGEPLDSPDQTSSEEDNSLTGSQTELNAEELLRHVLPTGAREEDDASSCSADSDSGSASGSCVSGDALVPDPREKRGSGVSGEDSGGFPQAAGQGAYVGWKS